MRHFVCFVVTLAMAVCLTGCKQEQQQAKAPAPLVSVYKVQAKDVPWPCDFQATAAGSRSAEVRARITGVIQKRLYKEGDYIKAGQLMFQIERDTYEAAYERAKAAFNNAEREWNRVRPLYAANAVSQKERDQALSDYESAKAALRQDKVNLDYCQVVAPVSGYTSKESMTVGNLVSSGTLLTSINQTDPLYIDFSMSAQEYMLRHDLEREGRLVFPEGGRYKARLTLLDGSAYPREGVVNFIDTQVIATMSVIRCRAEFPNDDNSIMPGQYVRVHMEGDVLKNAVLIPQTCVSVRNKGMFVVSVGANNIVKRNQVEIITAIGDDYLVRKGVSDGDVLVRDGILKTVDGQPVRIAQDEPSAGAPEQKNAQTPAGK